MEQRYREDVLRVLRGGLRGSAYAVKTAAGIRPEHPLYAGLLLRMERDGLPVGIIEGSWSLA